MASSTDLYRYHVLNLRAVAAGVKQIDRQMNAVVAVGNERAVRTLLNVKLVLLCAWAENRLLKLIFEPNSFDEGQRDDITAQHSQIERWARAVELGFRQRYNIPTANLSTALNFTARVRYIQIAELIDAELRPLIEMWNAMAHGQWERPLNSTLDAVSTQTKQNIENETPLSSKFKQTILECIAILVHELVAGGEAFERDFDRTFVKLENAIRDLTIKDDANWQQKMKEKWKRRPSP